MGGGLCLLGGDSGSGILLSLCHGDLVSDGRPAALKLPSKLWHGSSSEKPSSTAPLPLFQLVALVWQHGGMLAWLASSIQKAAAPLAGSMVPPINIKAGKAGRLNIILELHRQAGRQLAACFPSFQLAATGMAAAKCSEKKNGHGGHGGIILCSPSISLSLFISSLYPYLSQNENLYLLIYQIISISSRQAWHACAHRRKRRAFWSFLAAAAAGGMTTFLPAVAWRALRRMPFGAGVAWRRADRARRFGGEKATAWAA